MSTSHQHAEKKRKQVLISSSDSEEDDVPVPVPMNYENLEKSLCNLQINMRELGEKLENMMEIFKGFNKEATEALKGFEKEAKMLADVMHGKHK